MHSDDILAFLDSHPDFLLHHAERFGLSMAPQSQDRVVVSFAERQLLEQKDKARQLEARLHQLIRHAEANDQIVTRSHQLSLALLKCHTPNDVIHTLNDCFERHFGLHRMAIRLWHPGAEPSSSIYNTRHDVIALASNLSAPYCGPYVNDEIMSWFPATPVLQSFAQIALYDQGGLPFGLLVLASDDAQRFTFDMHTHYLAQIGELIATSLERVLEKA